MDKISWKKTDTEQLDRKEFITEEGNILDDKFKIQYYLILDGCYKKLEANNEFFKNYKLPYLR